MKPYIPPQYRHPTHSDGSVDVKMLLACVFFVFLAMLYSEFFSGGTKQELGQLKQANAQIVQDAVDDRKVTLVVEKIQDEAIQVVAASAEKKETVKKTTELRIDKSLKKIDKVVEDPSIENDLKVEMVARIEIEALWESYCAIPGSECKPS